MFLPIYVSKCSLDLLLMSGFCKCYIAWDSMSWAVSVQTDVAHAAIAAATQPFLEPAYCD